MLVGVSRLAGVFRKAAAALFGALVLGALITTAASAQQQSLQSGAATGVNLVNTAQTLRMQDMYARALYTFLRNNPALFDNPQFYATFVAYLLAETEGFECSRAFSNEFERRDFFNRANAIKPQIGQAIGSVRIPLRFDIAFRINTGNYDFAMRRLPFSSVRAIGLREQLSDSVRASQTQNCVREILKGTQVDSSIFPWTFEVVNEAAKRQQPRFPFGGSLELSDADARLLFNRFGRQLYAIVSYRFQAATNGTRKIQIVPTDGQLFGLSSNAVVRVKSFQHPSLSQVSYLDMSNPLKLEVPDAGLDAQLQFQQQGFRAVGTGSRKDPGTAITAGGEYPVSASAAVGNSVFIMRVAAQNLRSLDRYGRPVRGSTSGQEQFLTLFGSVDFERIRPNYAPVSGVATFLQADLNTGVLQEGRAIRFSGGFVPTSAPPPDTAGQTPVPSQLDTSPIVPSEGTEKETR